MTEYNPDKHTVRTGVRRLFRLAIHTPDTARSDASDELDAMIEARVEQLAARGMSLEDARTEALRHVGGPVDDARALIASSVAHREKRFRLRDHIDQILNDAHLAIRSLVRKPAFTATVVLTLALGIGATTGVFSIVNGVLLRALPYPNPDRLVRVFETAPPSQGGELRSIAIPTLSDWRRDVHSFDGIALYGPQSFDISGEHAERIQGATASAELFSILDVHPLRGRFFSADEELPAAQRVAVLSYGLWQRRFGADSQIVGRTVRLNRESFTVIGVAPQGFAYPANAELWTSLATDDEYNARDARHMSGLARLKPNATIASATADLLSAEHQLANVYPKSYAERGIQLISLEERLVGNVRPVLSILAGAVLLVLLVACTNIANLLVARASARHREIAIRTALGATRARVARVLLTESMILFVFAGIVGLGIALLIVRGVRVFANGVLPRVDAIQLDVPVVLFATGVTLLTGFIFGLLPAIQGSHIAPAEALLEGGRGLSGSRRGGRMRAAMIVVETALAAMLLVGAGLLVRSMNHLREVDPGLQIANVVTFSVSAPPDRAKDPQQVAMFFADLQQRIGRIPGVEGVGLASRLPLSGDDHSNSFRLNNEPAGGAIEHSAQDRAVSAGYFHALGIKVIGGREFNENDGSSGAPVVMVNAAFAKRWFPGTTAVGQRFVPGRAGNVSREIVGVVADTKQFSLDAPAEPEFYIPHAQDAWPFLQVAVHTRGEPLLMLPRIQDAVWSLDRELPLANVRTLEQMTAEGGAQRRLVSIALTSFAVLSYLLAAVGLYGVIAYAVSQRTAEFGIRLALGAQRNEIARMVMTRGLQLASLGAVLGLVAAVPLTRWLRTLLFGVTERDAITFVAVGLLIPLVALLASAIPARRALRIDPALAMRGET